MQRGRSRRELIMRAVLMAGALGVALAGGATAEPIGRVSAIHVAIGPKLQARASVYGDDQLEFLQNELEGDVQGALEEAGLTGPGGARVALTIVDAQAGRPTFRELETRPALSLLSPRLGGASIEGAITYPDGRVRSVSFRWYENDIRQEIANTPWSDAQWAFESFAHTLARPHGPPGG